MGTFYGLMITQALSMLGSRMSVFAIGVWLFTTTGDTTPLLLIPFFLLLPVITLSSLAGVIADRFPRKQLIILGDLGQAVPTILLLVSFASTNFELWHLYIAIFVQSLFGLLQNPSIEASITMLVPNQHRDRANALRQISQPAAGALGPPIASVLYVIIGVEGVLLVDLVTFALAVVVISKMTIPQPASSPQTSETSLWRQSIAGLLFMYKKKGLFFLILYFTYVNFVTNGVFNLITPYLLLLTGSETTSGALLGLSGLGLVTGGLLTFILPKVDGRINAMRIGDTLAAIGMIIFGITRSIPALAIVLFAMMLPYKMTNARLMSVLQTKVPPDMQGRVFAFNTQLATLVIPLMLLITGPLVDQFLEPAVGQAYWWQLVAPMVGNQPGSGIGLYILVCGMFFLIGVIIAYSMPRVKNIELQVPDYDEIVSKTT